MRKTCKTSYWYITSLVPLLYKLYDGHPQVILLKDGGKFVYNKFSSVTTQVIRRI